MADKKKALLNDTKKIGFGVGLTAAAVAAAGTFFLYGSKGASKHRKAVKSWALKAKAEVLEKLEDAKKMNREEYEELIGTVARAYTTAKTASKKDIVEFSKEMKDHWKLIEKAATPLKQVVAQNAKKVAAAVGAVPVATKKVTKTKKVAKKAAK